MVHGIASLIFLLKEFNQLFSEGYALMLAKIMKKISMAKIFTCLLIPVSNTGYDQSSANEYPIVNANGDSLYEFNECIKVCLMS